MSFVPCQMCNSEFYVKPSHQDLGWGKYCSILCRSKAQRKGKMVVCSICNKKIYRSPAQIRDSKSGKFFCNKTCQTKWRNSIYVGEKHPNWITGIRSYRKILLESGIEQICKSCDLTDKRVLVAHHLDHDRKNNILSNLIWLCMNCHHLVHNHKGLERDKINAYV